MFHQRGRTNALSQTKYIMKKFFSLPALIAIVSVLTGCDKEPLCPIGYCYDEYQDICIPCNGGGYYPPSPDTSVIVVSPPVVPPQLIWEPVPGQGIIYLHTGTNINIGPTAMLTEFGMVFVYIAPSVFGQAAMLAETEREMNPMFPRPLLVTYGNVIQPIQTGFGPVYRTAVSFSICTMCMWQ